MGEFRILPELHFAVEGKEEIKAIGFGILGIRFFIFRIMSIDAGITYATDYKGIADMLLHTNVTATFSLKEAYEKLTVR